MSLPDPNTYGNRVYSEIGRERAAQDAKWGEQNHPDGTGRPGDGFQAEMAREICKANGPGEDNWRDILTEEVHEAYAETDPARLRAELVQVAAVVVAWIEAIDRRGPGSTSPEPGPASVAPAIPERVDPWCPGCEIFHAPPLHYHPAAGLRIDGDGLTAEPAKGGTDG